MGFRVPTVRRGSGNLKILHCPTVAASRTVTISTRRIVMSTAINSKQIKKALPSIPTVRISDIFVSVLPTAVVFHVMKRVSDDGNLHLQLNLPRCHPYVHPEIVANPIIEQVAGAVLHGLVYIRYINGNTACRTTIRPCLLRMAHMTCS